MKALLVKDGEILQTILPDAEGENADRIHELIGNFFTVVFNVQSSRGGNHVITGYCDDEGLLDHSPNFRKWNVVPHPRELRRDFQPIAGPIVITGTDMSSGSAESLTDTDIARFYLDPDQVVVVDGLPVRVLRCGERSLLRQIKENLKNENKGNT